MHRKHLNPSAIETPVPFPASQIGLSAVVRGAQGVLVLDVGEGKRQGAVLPQDQQGGGQALAGGLRVGLEEL